MVRNIVLVGCGAVGLPLAVALANSGWTVVGVEINPATLEGLKAGKPEHQDEGLQAALRAAMDADRLSFRQAVEPMAGCTGWILAVPTPVAEGGIPVTRFVDDAIAALDAAMADGDCLAIRATVSIGSARQIAERLSRPGRRIRVAACPDRSLAGNAFQDQTTIPNVVGGVGPGDGAAIAVMLQPLGRVIEVSTPETAEALKLFANVYRDVRFAMANEMALICEAVGVDFSEVAEAGVVGYGRFDPGRPGPVGGPCLTKDVHLLAAGAGTPTPRLGLAARAVNEALLDHAEAAVTEALRNLAQPAPLAVLGLAFKGVPETLDRRGAVGVSLARRLVEGGHSVRVWDPATDTSDALREAVSGTGVVVLANDHPALRDLDLTELKALMQDGGVVLDLCGQQGSRRRPGPPGAWLRIFGDGARPQAEAR